ncbi:MAG: M23 family metallopeptidase [Chloroflexota bacterium]|nr:M23 family metallopeptidase [Chloroflexota bacterium]
MQRISLLFILVLMLSMLPEPLKAQNNFVETGQPTDSRPAPTVKSAEVSYFPETGHYLGYGFRLYWQKNGGLAQFGYPLTEEFKERNPADGKIYTVQYFERARFEYHPEFAGTSNEVELGLLGLQYLAGRRFPEAQPFSSTTDHYYFPETRHSLSYGFKRYWDSQGSLAIYGYPVSEETSEGGYIVQYFERARFEYHPELKGTPYEVLLGLLGTAALETQGRRLPTTYTVNLDPGAVVQGRTLAVMVTASTLANVSSSLDGIKLNFVVDGSRLVAFAPVSSNAALKPQLLKTEIVDNTGVIRRFEQTVQVVAGKFDQQTIQLDPGVEASLGTAEDAKRERERDFGIYAEVTPTKLWDGRFTWPCNGPITTEFGSRRNYVGGGSEIHDGIDLGVAGGTPILAPQYGRVVLAELQKVRGNIVIIDHGLGLHSAYFHQSKIKVKVGDLVSPGDIIGWVGTTGLSTGAHLHWEMRLGAVGIDPQEWIRRTFP